MEVITVGKRRYRKAEVVRKRPPHQGGGASFNATGVHKFLLDEAAGGGETPEKKSGDPDNRIRYELLHGLYVDYYPGFLSKDEADELFELCKYDPNNNTLMQWKQGEVVSGKGDDRRLRAESRLTTFLGEEDGLSYTYSSKTNITIKWPPLLESWKTACEELAGHPFNAVYANWYADGGDLIGWHADAERDMADGAGIMSMSLGQTRTFELRHFDEFDLIDEQERIGKIPKEQRTPAERRTLEMQAGRDPKKNLKIDLNHGDLLFMCPGLQGKYRHRVPKTKADVGPRINFTYRLLKV